MPASASNCTQRGTRMAYTYVLGLLIYISSLVGPVVASMEDRFVSVPAQFAARVPARLVHGLPELIQCWQDPTAVRCVLKDSISIDQDSWQQSFQHSRGVALVSPEKGSYTLTSEPCSLAGSCLPGVSVGQHTLDFGRFAYSMFVQQGSTLVFSNIQLFNLAQGNAYQYSPSQPYKSTGQGTTTWPSIGLAPNATLVLVNSSILYINPSDTDNCETYSQKRIFAFRQAWGEGNITRINSTTNLVVGPLYISVTIRNASDENPIANATVVYTNVSFTCMPKPTVSSGLSAGGMAAAIAVPVGCTGAVAVMLLLCLHRRRSRHQQGLHVQQLKAGKVETPDIETGQRSFDSECVAEHKIGGHAQAPQTKVRLAFTDRKGDSFSSSKEGPEASVNAAAGLYPVTPCSTALMQDANNGKLGSGGSGGCQRGPSGPLDHDSGGMSTGGLVHPEGTMQWQNSTASDPNSTGSGGVAYTGDTSTVSGYNTECSSQQLEAGAGMQRAAVRSNCKISDTAALLKARSNATMLRDLRIGPLLGRGSYGHVYKGRWKATPVAVKIIEHHVGAQSSGGKSISADRETLLATSVSHPHVVTTYHISTMSVSERSAYASSWLQSSRRGSSQHIFKDLQDSRNFAQDTGNSSFSSDLDQAPPDMLETWIIMEFCEKGSLERAVRLGKFDRKHGEGQLVGIYKALLDTASGLDYLHSIGVVHGDLKTANVLLKGSTRNPRGVTCKITDFGLSRVLDPDATHISTGTYGTIVYMPKELLLEGRMTQATDIYSFGLMMWELFTSQPVMDESLSVGQMFYMIAYENWQPHIPSDCPPDFAALITACVHEDPGQRPTAQQLLRRLQRLYVQAKQQFAANKPPLVSEHSQQPASNAAGVAAAVARHVGDGASRTIAATAGACTASGEPATTAGLVSISKDLCDREDGTAAGTTGSPDDKFPARHSEAQHDHAGVLLCCRQGRQSAAVFASGRSTISADNLSAVNAEHIRMGQSSGQAWRQCSTDHHIHEKSQDHQPMLQMTMHSVKPVLGDVFALHPSACTAASSAPAEVVHHPAAPLGELQLSEQLLNAGGAHQQLQLMHVTCQQVPQQQLLQPHYALLPSASATTLSQQHAPYTEEELTDVADGLFDADGLASESLMKQLTGTSHAGVLDGADLEGQYSGYLHPPMGYSGTGGSPLVHSMQQTVEYYQQQLSLAQHQVQQQQQQWQQQQQQ